MMRCPGNFEQYRQTLGDESGDERNGILFIKPRGLIVQFSDGGGWEHVSVSRSRRTPSYEDMDYIKQKFWSKNDTVMQLHVPIDDHINCHPNCLHLWRPMEADIPRPPAWMVGLNVHL